MNVDLQFNFVADKETNTITIKREFSASKQMVWDCYTKSELLDQWFAPKPLTTKTKSMDFSEGGHWHYAMIDPAGPEYWGRMDYKTIKLINNYTALDGFCDEAGVLSPGMPRSNWDVTFTDPHGTTLVQTVVSYKSTEDLERVIKMGLKEGLKSTLERLDELLLVLTK